MENGSLTIEQEGLAGFKRSPLASAIILVAGIGLGCWGANWFYADRLADQQERMVRLTIAAGLSQPSPMTALTELTNRELKDKANRLVEKIRKIVLIHGDNLNRITKDAQVTKRSKEHWKTLWDQEEERATKDFDSIRVDALMISDELRARLAPHVHKKVMTAKPHFAPLDEPKADFPITRVLVRMDPGAAQLLADELEELSKLQLERLEVCKGK